MYMYLAFIMVAALMSINIASVQSINTLKVIVQVKQEEISKLVKQDQIILESLDIFCQDSPLSCLDINSSLVSIPISSIIGYSALSGYKSYNISTTPSISVDYDSSRAFLNHNFLSTTAVERYTLYNVKRLSSDYSFSNPVTTKELSLVVRPLLKDAMFNIRWADLNITITDPNDKDWVYSKIQDFEDQGGVVSEWAQYKIDTITEYNNL